MQFKFFQVFAVLAMVLFTASGIQGCGPCTWESGVVLINSTVMLPSECVALGGDCCTWDWLSWCDGLGDHQDPAEMDDAFGINCKGCYYGWVQTTTTSTKNLAN